MTTENQTENEKLIDKLLNTKLEDMEKFDLDEWNAQLDKFTDQLKLLHNNLEFVADQVCHIKDKDVDVDQVKSDDPEVILILCIRLVKAMIGDE